MKKTLLCGLLAATLLTAPAKAARQVPVQVDGALLESRGTLEDGVTYVPLRTLLDHIGGWELEWDSLNKQAVATSGSQTLIADPNADTVALGGMEYGGSVYVENGRTFVPLRLTANILGGSAVWDPWLDGAAMTTAKADYDAVELYWLSRIISAESRGEAMDGQIAVGNVVLNRVESEEFPNTIPGVIFDTVDGVQFEPVENGTVYDMPTEQAMEAARRTLDGEEVIGDALYFYAPALSHGVWINANRTYHDTIGCHRFYL